MAWVVEDSFSLKRITSTSMLPTVSIVFQATLARSFTYRRDSSSVNQLETFEWLSIVSVKLSRKSIDDADYNKVTLVTSQAYPDGFIALYALKCSPWRTV